MKVSVFPRPNFFLFFGIHADLLVMHVLKRPLRAREIIFSCIDNLHILRDLFWGGGGSVN